MPTAIEISNLRVAYDEKVVLENVDVRIAKGKITGIIGPNGAGKSTLFKSILGLLEPSAGRVSFLGGGIADIRKLLAYVPQKDNVDWTFPTTVAEVVMMGRYPHKGWFGRLTASDHAKAEQAMRNLDILPFQKRQIGALSGGQQQRMFIARALCQEADILLLDEPFVGVDIKTERKIIGILRALARQGKTILVIHHDLAKVREYFDEIIILDHGIVAAGPVTEQFTQENVDRAYGNYQLTMTNGQ